MLHLRSTSSAKWLSAVDHHLDEILVDHAHCERKAAAYAMNLLTTYVENRPLCEAMTEIVNEELDHFHQVLELLDRRAIRFRRLKPGGYGRRLNDLVRRQEPDRAVDRLLVASLIEARSCERFDLLRKHMAERDPELASFYDSLFESEARHHTTYVGLARHYADEGAVQHRLEQLAQCEADIIAQGAEVARMHS